MRSRALVLAGTVALALTACGGQDDTTAATPDPSAAAAGGFEAVLAEAKGQTVNWYMYGGDDRLNSYVNGYVKTELAKGRRDPEPGEDHRHRRGRQQGPR